MFAIGVIREWTPLNGYFPLMYWVWTWRNLGILKTAGLLAGPFLLIGWVLWRTEKEPWPALWLPLTLLALANFLLQMLGMLADPRGFDLVRQIVESRPATSYFADATTIQEPIKWLAHFHDAKLGLHSMTHPPGPILFYYFFQLLDSGKDALIGGCAVGLIASAGAAVMYAFAGLWTEDQKIRLTASAFYALLPALTVFFPEFDQVYPLFSMLLIVFWAKALGKSQARLPDASYAGAVLFAATFFAYNLLATGLFLIYFALYWLWRKDWARAAWVTFLKAAATAGAVCAGLYIALSLATGFRPIASFRHALANQFRIEWRPYLPYPYWDPYDFFMAAGIIALPILVFHLQRLWRQRDLKRFDTALTLIGLATVLSIDVSGLLRGETARVWIFLQPLVIAPVAMELCRFRWGWRISMFTLQWWILVCLKAKMTFVNP